MKLKFINSKVLLCSILAAIFFISEPFLADIISWKADSLTFIPYFSGIMSVLLGVVFISKNIQECIMKLILSAPLSYLCLQYFWKTEYLLRSLNWVYPGYGRMSAGGSAASGIMIILFLVLCLISIITAFCISSAIAVNKKSFKLEKLQLRLCGLIGIIIVAAVILLERQFPAVAVLNS